RGGPRYEQVRSAAADHGRRTDVRARGVEAVTHYRCERRGGFLLAADSAWSGAGPDVRPAHDHHARRAFTDGACPGNGVVQLLPPAWRLVRHRRNLDASD